MKNIFFQKGSIGLVVLVIVLSVVILGGAIGGALYYTKSQNDNEKSKTISSVIPTATEESLSGTTTPTATTTATDPTADWQTYTNEEYGFSFKYPEGWEYKTISKNQIEFNQIGNKLIVETSEIYSVGVFISNDANDSISGLYNQMIADKPKDDSVTIVKTAINSTEAIVKQSYLQTKTYFLINNKSIKFVLPNFGSSDTNQSVKAVYDQILSTFQFTQ